MKRLFNVQARGGRFATAIAACLLIAGCRGPQPREGAAPEGAPATHAASSRVADLVKKPLYTFDEDEVDRYLRALPEIEPDLHRRIVRLARQNLGQPYEIYLLGEFPFEQYDPDPIYCLDKGDCVVFSEHMYAMGLSRDWWSFLTTLQRLRYRNGAVGMLTRNHYGIADWNPNNAFLFEDITNEVGGGQAAVPLTQVCRRAPFFKKFGIGQDIPDEPIRNWYIPKERIPDVQHEFRDADMVNIIRGDDASQWCGHVGMIGLGEGGVVNFIHSARPAAREQPLVEYVNGDKRCLGIKVLRLRADAEQRMAAELASDKARTPISDDSLNAALAARRASQPDYARYPRLDWRQAARLQAYRLGRDTQPDEALQSAVADIDREVAAALGLADDQRAFGLFDVNDQRLALVNADAMFYGASVPKVCILLAYFETHPEHANNLPDDVRDELGRMIKLSDNALAAKYGQLVGVEKIQELLQSSRYRFYDKETRDGFWYGKHYGVAEPRMGDPVNDHSHAATVRQCLRYLLMLEQGNLVNATAAQRMREIFASPQLEHLADKFVTGLQGRDLAIIRKSGTWEDWHLDMARVEHGDRVYYLAGATHHPKGAEYLAQMAARIDELLCGPADVRPFQHERVAHADLNVLLSCPPSGETKPGEYTSPVIGTDRLFNEALVSWNIDAPPHVGYAVELRVGRTRDDSWTPFLHVTDEGTFTAEKAPTKCDDGHIDVDYFRSDTRFDRAQYRVRALCNAVPDSPSPPQAKLRIARVDVTFSDTTRRIMSTPMPQRTSPQPTSAWQRRLAVPYRSQKVERREIRGRICSPTSVSMVLAYRGVERPTEEVASVIYDTTSGIYGNWPRAVQGAYRFGVPGYLDRFSHWADIEQCIAAGQPLVISIEAAEGELRGAPYRRSNGHLLVLAGFDADGMVLVNDPAAPDAKRGLLSYHRSDLEKVWWEARGGTAYVLLPPAPSAPVAAPNNPADDPIVDLSDVDPRIVIDLRYATDQNFTNQVLYPAGMRCRLRASVAQRLRRVQDHLVAQGMGLKIYDGLRPLEVQRTMWQIMPDSRYVADPAKGSRHNRGAAVDVTLVDLAGRELEMPTPYDDFTEAAHRAYAGCSDAAAKHRKQLEEAMYAEGFTGLQTEWWHFDAPNWQEYALVDDGAAVEAPVEMPRNGMGE